MTSQTTLCFCTRCLQRNPLGVQVTVATRDAHTQRDIDEELEHIDGKATTWNNASETNDADFQAPIV